MVWEELLETIYKSNEYQELMLKVDDAYKNSLCFPPKNDIFRALELTPFDQVKVVIIGQDPYHNDGQANGLAFSVNNGIKIPPSLRNIFAELYNDLSVTRIENDLSDWAHQGVLLLNATLTVKAHEANSHKDLGWEYFTDNLIRLISEHKNDVIYVLWGAFAQKKSQFINLSHNIILESAHPSPLSAHRGFFGSKPFSKINSLLEENGKIPINW